MEKFVIRLFNAGVKHDEILKFWKDQTLLRNENLVFGTYKYCSRANYPPQELFLNINEKYFLINKHGVGQSWYISENSSFELNNHEVKLNDINNHYYNFSEMNLVTDKHNNSDKKILTNSKSKLPIAKELDEVFIKNEFPKIILCSKISFLNNIFSNSITLNNRYVAVSNNDLSINILNDKGRFRSYPKELFEEF